jgi:hypothetical protein
MANECVTTHIPDFHITEDEVGHVSPNETLTFIDDGNVIVTGEELLSY